MFFVGCFGVVCVFCYTNCLTPTFFTQKLWSSSPVSVKGHWTCASTHVMLRLVFRCLLIMDCLYPRDLPQPARKKKSSGGVSFCPGGAFLLGGVSLWGRFVLSGGAFLQGGVSLWGRFVLSGGCLSAGGVSLWGRFVPFFVFCKCWGMFWSLSASSRWPTMLYCSFGYAQKTKSGGVSFWRCLSAGGRFALGAFCEGARLKSNSLSDWFFDAWFLWCGFSRVGNQDRDII